MFIRILLVATYIKYTIGYFNNQQEEKKINHDDEANFFFCFALQ